MEVKKGALLVPQRAVMDIQGKNLVAVVGADNKVDLRPVKVAEQIGSDLIISEGLKAGEKVIVEGVQKVKSGAIVNPKPFGAETPAAPAKSEAKPASSPSTEKR
jgi:membrane fusion protein (multidrug efflux system)